MINGACIYLAMCATLSTYRKLDPGPLLWSFYSPCEQPAATGIEACRGSRSVQRTQDKTENSHVTDEVAIVLPRPSKNDMPGRYFSQIRLSRCVFSVKYGCSFPSIWCILNCAIQIHEIQELDCCKITNGKAIFQGIKQFKYHIIVVMYC